MAITKITAPLSTPVNISDWEAMHAHMTAFIIAMNNQQFILTNMNTTALPAIAQGSFIQFGGSLYVVDTEDYIIQGTPSEGINYIKISGTSTLTAEWINSDSGYAWNYSYCQKISGSYGLLPYIVVKSGSNYYKKYTFNNINEISNLYVIESSTTFIVPDYSRMFAFCIGGGGRGGNGWATEEAQSTTGYYGGSGGGSGYTNFTELFSIPSEELSITIGAGGVSGDTNGKATSIINSGGVLLLNADGGNSGGSLGGIGEYVGGARGSYREINGETIAAQPGIGTVEERKNAHYVGGYNIDYSLGSGGGGGARNTTTGASGSSGGGKGGDYTQAGENATTYGSGGGGGGSPSYRTQLNNGGNGKSGVAIIVVI